MDSLGRDDKLTIVNGSMEHRVSKELIRKIPYFDMILSHDNLESKENKVTLDFDEKALKSFLDWIELGYTFIEMDYVINLCTIMDYFGTKDHLIQNCADYLNKKFSSVHLPVVIPQMTSTTELIKSDDLNAFICRFFLKIVNTAVWLDYQIQTIEYICALDLMVHSEYQVFEAIMKWVEYKSDSRKRHLGRLLMLVRWCHLEDKDLAKIKENEFVKSTDFQPPICFHDQNNRNCCIDRTKQGYFVAIERLSDKNLRVQVRGGNLRVQVLDGNLRPLTVQVVQSDESLPLNLLHGKHVSDIPLNSGRSMILIDWKQNKYRLLDDYKYRSYYHKIEQSIFQNQRSVESCIEKTQPDMQYSENTHELSLLEAAGKFILVCNDRYNIRCWDTPSIYSPGLDFESRFNNSEPTYHATVLDNNIYMLTKQYDFFRFNIDRKFERIGLERLRNEFAFDNMLITSKQTNDDRIFFMDGSRDIFCYNVSDEKWQAVGQIVDCKSDSSNDRAKPGVLMAFTFGFVSTDAINLCLNR